MQRVVVKSQLEIESALVVSPSRETEAEDVVLLHEVNCEPFSNCFGKQCQGQSSLQVTADCSILRLFNARCQCYAETYGIASEMEWNGTIILQPLSVNITVRTTLLRTVLPIFSKYQPKNSYFPEPNTDSEI